MIVIPHGGNDEDVGDGADHGGYDDDEDYMSGSGDEIGSRGKTFLGSSSSQRENMPGT